MQTHPKGAESHRLSLAASPESACSFQEEGHAQVDRESFSTPENKSLCSDRLREGELSRDLLELKATGASPWAQLPHRETQR